jgi:hypothetical protein
MMRRLVLIGLGLLVLVAVCHADLTVRPTTNVTIAPMNESSYQAFETAIGGVGNNTTSIEWMDIFWSANDPFVNQLPKGYGALLLFSMPFVMIWIRTRKVLIPAVIGMICGGGLVLNFIPGQYHLFAVVASALCVLGIVFLAIVERR